VIQYFIRPSLRLDHATANDDFKKLRQSGDSAMGLSPVTNWGEYESARAAAVKYWTDSGWVTEGQLRASEHPK
jgi:hypothetical protein